jgi:hypothetical protein
MALNIEQPLLFITRPAYHFRCLISVFSGGPLVSFTQYLVGKLHHLTLMLGHDDHSLILKRFANFNLTYVDSC